MSDLKKPLHVQDVVMEDYSSSKRVQHSLLESVKRPRLDWISEDHPDAKTTTLLKAVKYGTIDQIVYISKNENDRILQYDLRFMEKDRVVRDINGQVVSGSYTNDDIEDLRTTGNNRGPEPICAGPVLEVISVSIYKKNIWNDFQVYGDISLTDYLRNTYNVYNSSQAKPELVLENSPLSLTTCPIAPVIGPTVKFNLKDAVTHVPIFKDDVDYYLDDSLEYGQQVTQDFPGEGDYVAKMVYKKTPFAVLAELEFFLNYKPATYQVGTEFKVSGTIKANNIICWESSSKGDDMKYATSCTFKQSRSVFAVSIGTPIELDLSWRSTGVEFEDSVLIRPKYYFEPTAEYDLTCQKTDYSFRLDIDFASHDDFFHIMYGSHLDMKRNPNIPQKYPLLEEGTSQVALVEVFSVLLRGCDSLVVPLICGQIVVGDQHGKVYIFARNKGRPDFSQEKQFRTLSLAWPDDKWVLGQDFDMQLKLKDDKDNQVCKGYLSWVKQDSRFDTRLCDVILGENGYYAAVHYSVFLNGKKAKVSVTCNSEGVDPYCLVYGSIFAEYDNYDGYRSTYDEECYRIIVFKRSGEDCVKVKSGSAIPLSKSHVSAPSDCKSLSVHVDLSFLSFTTRSYGSAIDKLVFEAGIDQVRSCGEGLGHVTVGIQWFS